MKTILTITVLVFPVLTAGCAAYQLKEARIVRDGSAKTYLLQHQDTLADIRQAIEDGQIILGMCPLEVFASVGQPYFFHVKHDPQWPTETDPVDIIRLQCSAPDSSRIELFFDSYFPYRERRRYRVLFERGVVSLVEPLS